jgi:hypothetical protein
MKRTIEIVLMFPRKTIRRDGWAMEDDGGKGAPAYVGRPCIKRDVRVESAPITGKQQR